MASLPPAPMRLTFALLAAVLALGVALLPAPPQPPSLHDLRGAGSEHDVRVLRDEWGVPHVYGKTDADVAYGLAYAHAEDDFATIQGSLLAARGKLASVYGRDMAANDYLVALLRVWDFVDAKYETDLSPETRALCEAYAAGINRYAALHPKEALPGLFPARGKDVVAGFVHKLPALLRPRPGPGRAHGRVARARRLASRARRRRQRFWAVRPRKHLSARTPSRWRRGVRPTASRGSPSTHTSPGAGPWPGTRRASARKRAGTWWAASSPAPP